MAQPDPEHPILVREHPGRVTVSLADETIADTRSALVLYECGYPPVYYLPRADVAMERLEPTATRTHCPYKGDASYWNVQVDGTVAEDAAWSYEEPSPAVATIGGHLAFYSERVEIHATGD